MLLAVIVHTLLNTPERLPTLLPHADGSGFEEGREKGEKA
jgi:hypothetical protein